MDNIFQIGGAVSGNSFIGRKELVSKYKRDYLEGSNRVGRTIVGLTRIGKTSFADVVFSEVPDNILVISHDVKLCENYYGLWKKICLKISKYIKKRGISADYLEQLLEDIRESSNMEWVEFEENIIDIFDELNELGIRTIIVLDEFDYAENLFEGKTHYFELFRTLFADHKVSSMLISRRQLHMIEKTTYQSSTFHGVLEPIYFLGFNDVDMYEYFNVFEDGGIILTTDQKNEIEYYAGRSPFLLSVIGYYIVEAANNGKEIDITKIFTSRCKAINDYYRDIQRHLERDEDLDRLLPFVIGPNIGVTQNDRDELVNLGYLSFYQNCTIAISEYFTQFLSINMRDISIWDAIIGVEKTIKQIIEREMASLIEYYQVYGETIKDIEREIILNTPDAMNSISRYDTFIADTQKKFLKNCTYFDVMSLNDSLKIIMHSWNVFSKYFRDTEVDEWREKFKKCGNARNPIAHGHEEYITDLEKQEVDVYCKEILDAINKVPISRQGVLLSEEELINKSSEYNNMETLQESLKSDELIFRGEETGTNKNLKGTIVSEGEHKGEKGSIAKSYFEAISKNAADYKNKNLVVTIIERNPQNNGYILDFVREL